MRRIPYGEHEAAAIVAADDALLDAVAAGEPAALRWYGYRAPALVLGYGQRPEAADDEACARLGLPVVRRRGGGAAVLADRGLLGLSVALPPGHPLNVADVTQAYRWLGESFAAALDARVVDLAEARADAAAARGTDRALVCFGSLSPFEVAAGPRKLVGLAQIRRRGATLFQAGVYLRPPAYAIADLLALPPERRPALTADLAARITDLRSATGREWSAAAVIDAVEREFARRWSLVA